ncbi:MAG TPA: DUF86 domain-containing protein [Candidatus Margulisiibacteriota bacterium]|nr:DUF86 domain-containing protein [Candidatus Margulisiibacteriota bacterium]
MVLRPEALRERLLKLEEIISRLQETGQTSRNTLRLSFRDAWVAERGLQLGAEVLFDIGNHVLSAHFGVSPKDYEDIIAQLAAHGVIDEPRRTRLQGLGGFRNILVHGYLRVDPDRVADYLVKAPADFSEFARQVRDWLVRTTTT